MVGIPAGSFVMGSPPSESGRFDTEGPQHKVAIKAFALGKYDITSEQFLAFLRDTGYQPAPCNPLLDMGWRSPGRGKASPPYDADAPHWPAVCLDWRDAKRYVEWLNEQGPQGAPERRARARPLPPAERSRMGICRARRHHHGAVVGRRRSASTRPTATAAAASGTSACSPMSMPSRRTASGSTACWATPGNGPRIAGIRPMTARPTTAAPGPTPIAASTSFAAARGSACRSSCARRRAAEAA